MFAKGLKESHSVEMCVANGDSASQRISEFVDHIDAMITDVPEADPESLLREWHDIAQARMPAV